MDSVSSIFKKIFLGLLLTGLNTGCQMGYVFKSAYNQMSLLNQRVPIEKALQDPKLTEAEKRKITLAQEAREFAEKTLHLKPTQNYTSFVKLDRPYVTYVVSAAPRWELKHHQFSYPFVGKMPYKGYFQEKDAVELEDELKKENLDTYRRGVSAYSTLGWFKDPLLSSMLNYSDHDLVNTIIHETVHATIYIKHEADFNERLAVFLGNRGAEMFYLQKEGPDSKTLKQIQNENDDDRLFSDFISKKIKNLQEWYKNLPEVDRQESLRKEQFKSIQQSFRDELAPKLKGGGYKKFGEIELNNARLLVYKTYMQDLSDFEKLYEQEEKNFEKFLERCKSLEDAKDPANALKVLITK